MATRTGITHYAWPGGLAAVVEGPESGAAAVFTAGGWRIGPVRDVFPSGPPQGAEMVHLALPETLADQVATSLQLVGSGLHTDFVHLDRLVARLQADGADAALFVLGRAPAALVLSGGRVTVVEPVHEPVEEILTGADGWIVVGLGKLRLPAPSVAAQSATTPSAPEGVLAAAAQAAGPGAAGPTAAGPSADVQSPSALSTRREGASASGTPREDAAPPGAPTDSAGAYGRFASDARFVLAPGAAERLDADAAARIAEVAGDTSAAILALLDGAHTLAEIVAATGLAPGAVAAVIETLSAHRLVFRYVSRVRPPLDRAERGASTT